MLPPSPEDATTVEAAPASTAPSTTAELTRSPAGATGGGVKVVDITDGDTLTVSDGRVVRLAQVDAPETSECYGSESTSALRLLAHGQTVELRRPPSGPAKDRYGRTLADVRLGTTSINERLVAEGKAEWYEEFGSEDPDLAQRLQAAEGSARSAGLGLWSACSTAATTILAAPPTTHAVTPASTTAPPRSATTAPPRKASSTTTGPTTTAPRAGASGGCHTSYTRTCIPPEVSDADCAGGSGNGPWYVKEEDIGVVGPDVFDLDRDGDGVGCES
jgi:endonuclease YncB( thermonuclease family)